MAKLDAPAAADEAAPCAFETAPEAPAATDDAADWAPEIAPPAAVEAAPTAPDAPVWMAVMALPIPLPNADSRPVGLLEEMNPRAELTKAGSVTKDARAVFVRMDAIAGSEMTDPRLASSVEAAFAIEVMSAGTRSLTAVGTAESTAFPIAVPTWELC